MALSQESKMRKQIFNTLFIWILFSAVTTEVIFSQESDKGIGGSPYSAYGIGLPQDITSHNFRGQGLIGVSGITGEFNTLANPAIWGSAFLTQATTGLNLSKFKLDDGSYCASIIKI